MVLEFKSLRSLFRRFLLKVVTFGQSLNFDYKELSENLQFYSKMSTDVWYYIDCSFSMLPFEVSLHTLE
jgi:hypothetical protein